LSAKIFCIENFLAIASVGWAKGFLAHHLRKPKLHVIATITAYRGGQTKGAFAHPTVLRAKPSQWRYAIKSAP
jgi:hypothetical protein